MNRKFDKETKSAFKATELGKKLFIYYIICLVIFFAAIIADEILYHCIDVDDSVVINFRWFVVIVGVLAGFFEGQYFGALKQYALTKKNK